MQALGRLDFENELFIDDHIESLRREWFSSMIDHRCYLTINPVSPSHQVSLHRERVDMLTKSEPERAMDVVKHADDGMSELLLK
jgi:hypothetical protein